MKDNGVARSEIFYTTKLMTNVSYEDTLGKIDASLKACGLEYIDLYLLHSGIGGPEKRKECWRACVDAKKEGKVRSIGVSNFGVAHLQEMVDQGVELPSINQVKQLKHGEHYATKSWPSGRSSPFHDARRHCRDVPET